jgi:SAM-dependent methyltransferase
MRDSLNQQLDSLKGIGVSPTEAVKLENVPYDEKAFFESFYKSTICGEAVDRMTIGDVSEMESRFHYNCVENAIIKAMANCSPPPSQMMVRTWRMLQQRRRLRLLDVGSGTGHWIDFMMEVFYVAEAVGIEITDAMSRRLEEKYRDRPNVRILNTDIAAADFDPSLIGGPVDFVTAIGVMFHIVDDVRWLRALGNLARAAKPEGLLLIGGDFGVATRNVQFHSSDEFENWREYFAKPSNGREARVNKRVRSLADWQRAAHECGLEMVDLIRVERNIRLTSPENDLLVLQRPKQ